MRTFSIILLTTLCIGLRVQSQTITTGTINGSPFVPKNSVSVPYTVSAQLNSGNVFTAQLSNENGSFTSPTNIGTLTSRTNGTIAATIPATVGAGTGYRIRVISSNPAITGSSNTVNQTIISWWALNGNTGTNPNYFIGTTNGTKLSLKVSNQPSGFIDTSLSTTAFGFRSLFSNTTGARNTAMGAGALSFNSTGYNNVAVGNDAMFANNTGYDNVVVGDSAGGFKKFDYLPGGCCPTPFGNTAIGSKSMQGNGASQRNTAIGYKSMSSFTYLSTDNVAVGSEALLSNKKGSFNVAVGSRALFNNTEGGYAPTFGSANPGEMNIGIGFEALFNNLIGDNNTAIGYKSMYSSTTTTNPNPSNPGDLYNSGLDNSSFGNLSLYNNTVGDSNTAIGSYTMFSNVRGIGNTSVGANADVGTDSLYGATAIGFRSKVNCHNCLVLGAVANENNAKGNTRIGIGTISPDSSAIMELKSTERGLLIPRMTQAQREAIRTPAEGLLVYQTNNTKGFWYYNGTAWTQNALMNSTLQVQQTTIQEQQGKLLQALQSQLVNSTSKGGTSGGSSEKP